MTDDKKLILEKWDLFKNHTLGVGAPPAQVADMKLSFFAGASSMMDLNLEMADLSDDDAVESLDGVCDELSAFFSPPKKDRTEH